MTGIQLGATPDSDYALRIGVLIRSLRKARGLSLDTLAGLAGMHHPTLSRLERGFGQDVKVSTLRRLAQALDVAVHDLLPLEAGAWAVYQDDAAPNLHPLPPPPAPCWAAPPSTTALLERMYNA